MTSPKDLTSLSRDDLLVLVAELQRQLAELRAEIEQLTRGGKRQAAPFSKGTRVAAPSLPGASLALAHFATARPHDLKQSPRRR
jgi:uncharacterized small protein (DUF1192 family)